MLSVCVCMYIDVGMFMGVHECVCGYARVFCVSFLKC